LSQVDNEEWLAAWAAKREEVNRAMQAFVPAFKGLDPDAVVRIRGSLASGIKTNPAKVTDSGEQLLFNPSDFDIDAYVESNQLYREALEAEGSSDEAAHGQVVGSAHPGVNAIIRRMRDVLSGITGNRDTGRNAFRFNVVIRSSRNAAFKTRQDQDKLEELGQPWHWGNPLTIQPPAAEPTDRKSGE
jgi:hypothetical protein